MALLARDDLERARLVADAVGWREAIIRAEATDRPDVWFLADGDRLPI